MGAGLRLELRQSQQLVMTPQLQQAIKLLQMSNLELAAFVDDEIERNPLLSRVPEDGPTHEPEAPPPPKPEAAERADERLTPEGDQGLAAEIFDAGTENLYDRARADEPRERAPSAAGTGIGPGGSEAPDLEGWLAATTTLRESLIAQIRQMRAERAVADLAVLLVDELDGDGYFRADPAEVSLRLDAGRAEIEAALSLLQRAEPTGIGARDLAECLALQLAERGRLDPAMEALLANLDLLAKGDIARLRTAAGVDREDFADMIAELRRLDPRPGAALGAEMPETLIPDVFLRRGPAGEWQIELNPETLPRVLVDRAYAAELAAGGEEARQFVATCRETASWLVKSLDQRARTILKVTTEIARQQERFFLEGPAGLRPLSLKMVAEAIGMHESTVSRVTSNKYVATERGIFELKYFFSNAVGSEDMSAEVVRHRLRALIAQETAETVLSDDRIVEILRQDGMDIARRTVAKYRKLLKIPSSVDRRRRFQLGEVC